MSIDWNEITDAIAYKYGADSVAKPEEFWDSRQQARFERGYAKLHEKMLLIGLESEKIPTGDGFLVSSRVVKKQPDDRVCGMCNVFSFDVNDDIYMSKHGCCRTCYIKHVEGRE